MHRHQWVVVETIGRVVTEQCTVCSATRTRVRGSQSVCAGGRVAGCPDHPVIGSHAVSAPSSRIRGGGRPHGNEGT